MLTAVFIVSQRIFR